MLGGPLKAGVGAGLVYHGPYMLEAGTDDLHPADELSLSVGVDGSSQRGAPGLSLYVTGTLFGLAAVWFAFPYLADGFGGSRHQPESTSRRIGAI